MVRTIVKRFLKLVQVSTLRIYWIIYARIPKVMYGCTANKVSQLEYKYLSCRVSSRLVLLPLIQPFIK